MNAILKRGPSLIYMQILGAVVFIVFEILAIEFLKGVICGLGDVWGRWGGSKLLNTILKRGHRLMYM